MCPSTCTLFVRSPSGISDRTTPSGATTLGDVDIIEEGPHSAIPGFMSVEVNRTLIGPGANERNDVDVANETVRCTERLGERLDIETCPLGVTSSDVGRR